MHVIMRLNDNCLEIFPTLGFSGQSVQKALEADSPSQSLSCCWSVGCFDHHPACQLSQIHVLTSCGLGRAWHRGDSIPPFHDKLIILPPEIVPPNALTLPVWSPTWDWKWTPRERLGGNQIAAPMQGRDRTWATVSARFSAAPQKGATSHQPSVCETREADFKCWIWSVFFFQC